MKRAVVLPWVAMLLSAACASSKPSAPAKTGDTTRPLDDHMRLVFQADIDAGTGRAIVQTSVRTLRHPESGTVVVLLSMQHVADADYYRSLTVHLRDAEIVLAEGAGGQLPGKRLRDDQLPEEGLWVRREHRLTARVLDLQLQADWEARVVDDRWVLADMSTTQLVENIKANGVAFLNAGEKAHVTRLEGLLAGSPSADELAKARADLESRLVSGTYYYTGPRAAERKLHDEREVVMWRIVKDHLASHAHEHIAMVFGAWHAPYLESKLVNELGFRVEATCWHDAAVCENLADTSQAK